MTKNIETEMILDDLKNNKLEAKANLNGDITVHGSSVSEIERILLNAYYDESMFTIENVWACIVIEATI